VTTAGLKIDWLLNRWRHARPWTSCLPDDRPISCNGSKVQITLPGFLKEERDHFLQMAMNVPADPSLRWRPIPIFRANGEDGHHFDLF
jgi:hypothetical protein